MSGQGENILRIGATQQVLIRRAQLSRYGYVMPAGFAEQRACRKLEAQGILRLVLGFPDVWALTRLAMATHFKVIKR